MRIVDLFAGAGGFSEGAKQAGCSVLWSGNHWPEAVKWHSANHPQAAHVCQDLQQADWGLLPDCDLLLASPACQGFSRARGSDKPRHDTARSTAWAVIGAVEAKRPQFALIENVPEFQEWELYPAWELAMQSMGYTLMPYIIDAADHGVPQNRVRLFIVAARSKAPLLISLPRREHQPAPVRWDEGVWGLVEKPGRAAATLSRWRAGRAEHGELFLLPYYSSAKGGRSPHRPLGTVTTRDRYAAVRGDQMRMLTADEYRAAMGFPADYKLPTEHRLAVHLLGNAVCPPVAKDLISAINEAA